MEAIWLATQQRRGLKVGLALNRYMSVYSSHLQCGQSKAISSLKLERSSKIVSIARKEADRKTTSRRHRNTERIR